MVILTSANEEQDRLNGHDLGVNGYVRKPIRPEEFVEAVRQIGLYRLILNEGAPERRVTPCGIHSGYCLWRARTRTRP